MENFDILVAPVSGGSIKNQLIGMKTLVEKFEYEPDLSLGSSGGAISIYIFQATEWKYWKLNPILQSLGSDIFIQSWLSEYISFIPSTLVGFFLGSMGKISDKIHNFFDSFFTRRTIKKNEIWVAAINVETGSVGLFCNKRKEKSILKNIKSSFKLEEPVFMDGNIKDITDSVAASSCIPVVFEEIEINGNKYIDSGAKYGSPFTPLSDSIKEISEGKSVHITYFNGYNLKSNPPTVEGTNMISNTVMAGNHVVRSFVCHDRQSAINFISSYGKVNEREFIYSDLDYFYPKIKNTVASLLEVYVDSEEVLDYTNFTGQDIINLMENAKELQRYKLWWVGDKSLFSVILPEIHEFYSDISLDRDYATKYTTHPTDPYFRN